MCGIVGYTGRNQASEYLLQGLQTLEYRGYDSAGIEILSTDGALHGVKCAGQPYNKQVEVKARSAEVFEL